MRSRVSVPYCLDYRSKPSRRDSNAQRRVRSPAGYPIIPRDDTSVWGNEPRLVSHLNPQRVRRFARASPTYRESPPIPQVSNPVNGQSGIRTHSRRFAKPEICQLDHYLPKRTRRGLRPGLRSDSPSYSLLYDASKGIRWELHPSTFGHSE